MARKKKEPELKKNIDTAHVEGLRAEVLRATWTTGMSGASASRRRFRNGFMGPPWMKTVPERDDPPRHGLIVVI